MHRSSTALTLALACALATFGCGNGSDSVDNRPKAELTTPAGPVAGVVDVSFALTQRQSSDVNILPEYSLDGGTTFQRATAAPGSPILGLPSGPDPGINSTFSWDSRSDGVGLLAPEVNVVFRVTPYISGVGVLGETLPFTVDSTAIEAITSISPEWGPVGTSVTIDGAGFSSTPVDNVVTFGDVGGGGVTATPISATGSQLVVQVPDPTPQPLRDLCGPLTVTVLGAKTNAVQFVATRAGGPRISVIRPTSIEGNSLPWYPSGHASAKIQILFRQSEIGSAGVIDSFRWATSTGLSGPNPNTVTVSSVRMRMGHTTMETPTHIQSMNYDVEAPREVTLISNYTIPADTVGFFDVPLTGVFPYNGRDNLLIEIEGVGGSARYFWNVGRRPEERRAWSFAAGSAWRDIILPAVEIGFLETDTDDTYSTVLASVFNLNLQTPCVPPWCIPPSVDTIFPTGGSKVQFVLLRREISASGTLKGIAWKPSIASNAATYDDLAVSVRSFPLNTLTSTFESGLTQVRAPAPYTVPAGETGFIPIPLDAPFTFLYDGTEHLLIEITTLSGTDTNSVDGMDIAPERRLVWAPTPTAGVGTLEFDIASLRLEFE